jgi:PhzF family phenazine biosynthesis protein
MRQYVVDAFSDKVFAGNQAAICVVDEWPEDALMQAITIENNFSETAFVRPLDDGRYYLRWFTPAREIDFCGHATFAAGYVVLNFYAKDADHVVFATNEVGELVVSRAEDLYELDFPAYDLTQVPVTDAMEAALGARPLEAWMARDLLCVMDSAATMRSLEPDQAAIEATDGMLVHVTAAGEHGSGFDCVSRSFAPKLGIPEDPVCGSGHCHILPYWAERLGKTDLAAYQASRRGGELYGHVAGDGRCVLAGQAALFSIAELIV